jgi:hypothetical protein
VGADPIPGTGSLTPAAPKWFAAFVTRMDDFTVFCSAKRAFDSFMGVKIVGAGFGLVLVWELVVITV